MSEVKRWDIDQYEGEWATMREDTRGDYILASDYDRLKEAYEGAESQAEYQRERAEHFMAERDQLKADSEVVADLVESRLAENLRIKAENERIKKEIRRGVIKLQQRGLEMDELSNECYQLTAERDALRTKLDEARELLRYAADECIPSLGREIDAWLEANK